jgi:hypothetical protein
VIDCMEQKAFEFRCISHIVAERSSSGTRWG